VDAVLAENRPLVQEATVTEVKNEIQLMTQNAVDTAWDKIKLRAAKDQEILEYRYRQVWVGTDLLIRFSNGTPTMVLIIRSSITRPNYTSGNRRQYRLPDFESLFPDLQPIPIPTR